MMTNEHKSNSYEVGYGKPPKHTQFRPAQSGNPSGRPKQAKRETTNVTEILNEAVVVKRSGVHQKMSPFEAGVRKLVSRALNDTDLNAALEFCRLCETYEIVMVEPSQEIGIMPLTVPKTWDWDEWYEMFKTHGPPPWPGERSGLPESPRSGASTGDPQ